MNKVGLVLGVAALATVAGCKDPNYSRDGKSQDEVKQVEPAAVKPAEPVLQPEAKPVEKPVETRPIVVDVPPPAHAPTPAAEETTVYIVQPGDYLAKISKKFNIKISVIKSLNGLSSDKIRVGQKLKLPGKVDVGVQSVPPARRDAAAPAKAQAPKKEYKPYEGPVEKYTVKEGDFLGKIAAERKISVRQLKELNKLSSDGLKVGQKLDVPVKGGAAAKAAEAPKKEAVEEKAAVAEPAAQAAEQPAKDEPAAAVAAAPAVPAPAAPAFKTYEVKEGENIHDISAEWGLVPQEIRDLNNMDADADVKPGQIIKLPASASQE